MTEVIFYSASVTEALEVVAGLKERLSIHEDFRFSFHQGKYDWGMNEQIQHKTIFYFKDPAEATAFRLTYL